MTSRFIRCAGRELHYREMGMPEAPVVVMWHGLGRTCRDFDALAVALSSEYRVIAPDTIGRGLSQWATDPRTEYCMPSLVRQATELLDQLGVDRVRWIGTSMGGALGIHLAGGPWRDRIVKLVVNDIGPEVPRAAVERIRSYIGRPPSFNTFSEYEQYVRTIYKPYGPLSDQHYQHLALTTVRRRDDGTLTFHYDPQIVHHLSEEHESEFVQWDAWKQIACPMLVFRGLLSDLLLPEIVARMQAEQPQMKLVEVPNVGHTPQLHTVDQIEAIRRFLQDTP